MLELKSRLHTSETDNNLYFVDEIFVDGEAIADFRSYPTSLSHLKRSVVSSGTYFILTCWCGIFECVGIYNGVQVVHEHETVKWIISQPEPQRVFVFGADAYERAVAQGIEQMKRDVANLWFTASGVKDEKLEIVPGLDEDMILLEPKARVKANHRHRNS